MNILFNIFNYLPESTIKNKIRYHYHINYLKSNIFCSYTKKFLLIGLKNKKIIKIPYNFFTNLSVYSFAETIQGYLNHYIPKKGDVVIDAGAYDGTISLFLSKLVGKEGRIISFEPDTENFKKLKSKISKYNAKNIVIINKGLFSKDGIFIFNNEGLQISSLYSNNKNNPKKIKFVTLDRELEKLRIKKINFIKMDIEGAEIEAIKGSKRILENNNVKLAIASYHKINGKQTYIELEKTLRSMDYKVKTDFPKHLTTYASKE